MSAGKQKGFSLVELSIVILIMGLLLGSIAMPLAVQRDNSRIRQAQQQLEHAVAALEGFVLANGHLPCPAIPASDGLAANSAGACTRQHGFLPATTLNLSGARNADNLLLDPWGSALRYSVSAADADLDGNWDFLVAGEMRDVSLPALSPDLVICSGAAGVSASACAGSNATLAAQVPFVLYSLGKDWSAFSSADQLANVGASLGGGASGKNYQVQRDAVFVSRGYSRSAGNEFDDQIAWLPANALYRLLVQTGHLP